MWNTEVEGFLESIAYVLGDFLISLQKIPKKCGIKGERIFLKILDS